MVRMGSPVRVRKSAPLIPTIPEILDFGNFFVCTQYVLKNIEPFLRALYFLPVWNMYGICQRSKFLF